MESIIGKKYWPVDNSYSLCLTNKEKGYQLAGNHYKNPKQPEETEVISEPYDLCLWKYGAPENYTFVNVRCHRGLEHRVLFYERGFEPRIMAPLQYTNYFK